jgi:hypothetical protein
VGDVVGDDLDDLMIPAAGLAEVRLLPMPGDEQISADPTAGKLASGLGRLVWWRRDPAGGLRLVEHTAGATRDLPVRVPSAPARTILGRNPQGRPAVAYGRCSRACRAEAFDLVTLRERPVPLRLPEGCFPESVQSGTTTWPMAASAAVGAPPHSVASGCGGEGARPAG